MKGLSPSTVKVALFVLFVMTLVCLPFAVWGEEFVWPLLKSREEQGLALTAIAILVLACDSVAPIPATIVIMFLAWKAGWVAGIVGGTIGLAAGVVAASWIGKAAVGRLAPKFLPEAEIRRLRDSLQSRLTLTLACLRSVPVLAETSVIIAAATGVPLKRIFWATLLPNFVIATIYSVTAAYSRQADDSFVTAAITFVATMVLSYGLWRIFGQRGGGGRAPS